MDRQGDPQENPYVAQHDDHYAIKTIKYRRGDNVDSVGILLQDVNGPCPIIALFNVLLLRGNLSLPPGAGEVPVSRVVAMLAEYLLDKNEAMLNSSSSVSESVKADLQYNLADAISEIPLLTTGIDVNVRFNDIKGVEYTSALCVFDLLGIDLVHGWIVDPQDVETASAIRGRTYNEIALEVITRLASCGVGGRGGTHNDIGINGNGNGNEDEDEDDDANGNGVAESRVLVDGRRRRRTSSDAPSTPPSHKASVAKEELAQVLESMNLDRLGSVGESTGWTSGDVSRESSLLPRPKRTGTGTSSLISQDSLGRAIGALLDETVSGAFVTPKQLSRTATMGRSDEHGRATGAPDAADAVDAYDAADAGDAPDAAASELVTSALVIKEFLEANSSQLTYYGISSLHEGLEDGQLAVFFRNNHFSTLLKHGGRLFVLVTDQGYQNETDIVWETLEAVDNDSAFVGWDFGRFSPHTTVSNPGVGMDSADADFKLAQQLQAEEDARARRGAAAAAADADEAGLARRGRRDGNERKKEKKEKKEKKKKSSSLCSIM